VILIGTLVAIAIVALMIILPIVTDGDIPGESGDTYWRWFGAVAIVDALGTIVLPVIGRVLRPRAEAPLLPRS
jgi:Mn2+/Fe2+ NRAMP family transporter